MPLPATLDMLATLISLPSISSFDPAIDTSNRAVCVALAQYLEDAGARVSLENVAGTRDKVNLLARFGDGPPGLALCGHTDTVPYDEQRWRFDPFGAVRQDERMYGLGSTDMKGFLAICATALSAQRAHTLKRSVIVLGSADEETDMAGARALAAAGKPLAPFAVIGEPTGLTPVRQHKGILMEGIRLLGRSGHSSNPALGANAIDAAHDVIGALRQWRQQLRDEFYDDSFEVPFPTLNFGKIQGGDNPNRICAQVELHVDLRLMPGMRVDIARQKLRDIVTQAVADSAVRAEFDALFAGVNPLATPAQASLVRACEHVSGAAAGSVGFGTEAPWFTELGAESVVFGPGDIDLAHQPDEYLDMRQVPVMEAALGQLIEQYCRA